MSTRADLDQLETKVFHWLSDGQSKLDVKKKEQWKLSPEEVALLIEDLTLKKIQSVEIEHLNKKIAEEQAKYQQLSDSIHDGYIAMDENCGIKEANLAAAQMLGVERSELLKMNLEQFIQPDSQDRFREYYSSLLHTKTKQTQELILKNNSGNVLKARLSGITFVDSKKNTVVCRLFLAEVSNAPSNAPEPSKPAEEIKADADNDFKAYIRQRLYDSLSQKFTI
jgi:PAS domain S-box-containing protein